MIVQLRCIGPWSAKLGDRRLASLALGLLALGLVLTATTPQSPHPLYLRAFVERDLRSAQRSATEAVIGDLGINLPPEDNRGLAGVIWLAIAIVPVSVGAGLIRPALNSLITQTVSGGEYGRALGVSAALASAANACAPLIAGLIFQTAGSSAPFAIGGVLMAGLCVLSVVSLKPRGRPAKLGRPNEQTEACC